MHTVAAIALVLLSALDAAASTIVPFRYTPGQIEIEVSINGRAPVWCVLDSGAEIHILDTEVARSLDVTADEDVTIGIGPVTLRKQRFTLMALDNFRRQKRDIRGVIGYEFFANAPVTFDFEKKQVLVGEPPPKNAVAFPITFDGRLPVLAATMTFGDKRLPVRLMVDSGAATGVVLRHPFTSKHGLYDLSEKTTTSDTVALGRTGFATIPAKELTIGKWTFAKPKVEAYATPRGSGGYATTDGLVGTKILDRFRVTFDYQRKRMYLLPREP